MNGKILSGLLVFVSMLSLVWTGTAGAELVAHWRLDDGSGTVATDATGNGHDGTLIGDPTWVTGYLDGALLFSGSSQKVDVPYSADLNPTDAFSVTVWANPDSTGSSYRSPVTSRDDYPQRGYILYCTDGNIWSFWTGSGESSGWTGANGPSVVFDEWTHLVATYADGTKKLYVNGVLAAEQTAQFGPNTAQILRIGGGATEGAGNYFFKGMLDDVRMYNHAVTEAEIPSIMAGMGTETAWGPAPEDGATDVLRDVSLAWTAGDFAATHDVYLGTSFDDVNDAGRDNPLGVLVSQDQTDVSYDSPTVFQYGQTYYWRVDEVNAAPDYTIYKGSVWSFTVEPVGYPITTVTATASAAAPSMGPERTVDGSGLNENDQHSVASEAMWMTTGALPAWIQYEFDKVYKLSEMWVWNSNQQVETFLGFGAKDVVVEYSLDGETWTQVENVPQFAKATGAATYTANTTVDLTGAVAQYVRLTISTNWGGISPQTGLSEVRFFYVPVQPREPDPADDATDVAVDTVLTWRAGREAVSHTVYFGTDKQAVADGTAIAQSVDDNSYTPDELVFANVYYWKVVETNAAEAVSEWASDVWTFTTQEYGVIDGFESYNDDDNRIYDTWIDGWTNDTGSQVGYSESPFAEQSIVYNGRQSMPLLYNNGASPYYSEAYRTFETAQDWTANDADTARIYFRGNDSTVNEVAPLYMAIEDSSGNKKIVTHSDPNAVLATTWQVWSIPMSTFTDAGVKMTKVKTIYLGVGNRTSPTTGGAGTIYIDDVSRGTSLARHVKAVVTAAGDTVQGVPNDGVTTGDNFGWPSGETPEMALDGKSSTKFLHFKGEIETTGVQVIPSVGATVVTELKFVSANDAAERDPVTFELYGSNVSIDGPYTLIAGGDIVDFAGDAAWSRLTQTTTPITFENTTAYTHYQVLFPTVRTPSSANSMQIAEIELIGLAE